MKESTGITEEKERAERRQYPRNHLVLKVEGWAAMEESDDDPFEFLGYSSDVSLRGLCVAADQNPELCIGQQFKLMIRLFQGESPLEAIGKLCWCDEAEQGGQENSILLGLELLGVLEGPRGYKRWIERIAWH